MPLDSWPPPPPWLSPPPPFSAGWSGAVQLPPPLPASLLYPPEWRPVGTVDAWGVFLADPDGNLIGMTGEFGRGGAFAQLLDATRAETRNL